MQRRVAVLVSVSALLTFGLTGGAGGAARPGPDLRISAVSTPAGPVQVGEAVQIRVTTWNAGTRRAKRSKIALYLSRDARKSADDVRLGSALVPALKPRKSKRRTLIGTIPAGVATRASVAAGGYRLVACADSGRRVRERNERNNCRASRGTLMVGGPTAGGAAQDPGSAEAGGGGTTLDPAGDDDGDGARNSADCAPHDPTVYPGAPDKPDVPAFADSNCDGMDGDEVRAVFVSPLGLDTNPGTRAAPVQHYGVAKGLASAQGKDVYATFGNYQEVLDVTNGVGVYGGYGVDWSRSLSNETRFSGVPGAPIPTGAAANGITAPTTIQHVTLTPANATQPGAGSYGLRAVGSPGLVVEHVVATGGTGADGARGSFGQRGANGDPGAPGGAGSCDGTFGGGGGGPSGPRTGRQGGEGGLGADEDGNFGRNGQDGAGEFGGPGGLKGGNGDPGGDGANGGTGGFGTVGADGGGGTGGTVAGGLWVSDPGDRGTDGTDGFGGGGGGGGGAQVCFLCNNGGGNGGGEGGDGGERGRGGGGGGGGGGSFGIFLLNSSGAVVKDSVVTASDAGDGARGGGFGQGGAGGEGGAGGTTCTSEVGEGGDGGPGGFGGRGGDGGGGAGGPSIALFRQSSDITGERNTLRHGSGGLGGDGPGGDGAPGQASPTN